MKKLTHIGCAAALLSLSSFAWAGSESGFYLGGSLGSADTDISSSTVNFSDDDTGYKIFGGYNFGLVPFIDLAVEGSYIDFGEISNAGITGLDAFGLAGFKLGPIGLFAKAGVITWDSDFDNIAAALDDSGTDPAYGIGVRFQIGSVAIRGEYELFDVGDADIDYLSVGVAWTF
jgi:hypothetical protein